MTRGEADLTASSGSKAYPVRMLYGVAYFFLTQQVAAKHSSRNTSFARLASHPVAQFPQTTTASSSSPLPLLSHLQLYPPLTEARLFQIHSACLVPVHRTD